MGIQIDKEKGKKLAKILYNEFVNKGIFGTKEMPEDIVPACIKIGSLEHILFITLTVSIDYQRNADALWESARKTYIDNQTRYLFDPNVVHNMPIKQIIDDMQKHSLSRKPTKDAKTWQTLACTFHNEWNNDPKKILASCGWNAPQVLCMLKTHKKSFPYLSGDKIGPLWIRMMRDNIGERRLKALNTIPIPVDIHIARSSLALGIVNGNYSGQLSVVYEEIRKAWFESVNGLKLAKRDMIALDIDEPLWHLSKKGCTNRDIKTGYCPISEKCPVVNYCVKGKIAISGNNINIATE